MKITLAVLVWLGAVSAAEAIMPLDQAGSLAAAAGEVIGGAAGCGIRNERLAAVRVAYDARLEASGAPEASRRRAPSIFENFRARAMAAARADPSVCADAIRVFQETERGIR